MQHHSLPAPGATARMLALTLLAALVLVATLWLAELAARPAPDPPDPKPPMQFGPSAGAARAL